MNNKKAIEELTIDQVINVLCVDLENLQVKQNHFGVQNTRKVRIQAYKKAIEVLKHFEGAVEVVIDDFEINAKSESIAERAKIYMMLAENKVEIKPTISKTHKLYAIPKTKEEQKREQNNRLKQNGFMYRAKPKEKEYFIGVDLGGGADQSVTTELKYYRKDNP